MKCHKHYESDAVSTCVDCGKALCPVCTEKFTFPICDNCNLARINSEKSLLIKNSIVMIIMFFIGFSFNSDNNLFESLLLGYFFAGVPWGWSTLNKITPNIFLFMPVIGWVIYFVVKFIISIMIGMFVTPFKIYGIINGLKQAKANEIYTRAG